MSTELNVVENTELSEAERDELSASIDAMIAAHKSNRQEINCLVFESVAAMTAGEDYERQLANKKGLRRLLGEITGSNKKLQDKINSSRAAAQYASQMTLQKLAEQNLMSFDLIAAVNNKLNASVLEIEGQIREIVEKLLLFFKQSRSDLVQLENRISQLEQNVRLLRWQTTIEYQTFNGVEYRQLDTATKIVCIVRDFYDLTEGLWTTAELLQLKSALGTVNIPPQYKVNYLNLLLEISKRPELRAKLLGGFKGDLLGVPYMLPLNVLDKAHRLACEERYISSAIHSLIPASAKDDDIQAVVLQHYLDQEMGVNLSVEIECFDVILDLLFSLSQFPNDVTDEEYDTCTLTASDMYNLGRGYEESGSLEENLKRAVYWYRRAANLGLASAAAKLGECYLDGKGVVENQEEAVTWYRRAAEQGDIDGEQGLGYCYLSGEGVAQDYSQGIYWTKKAAERGGTDAQINLGNLYYSGEGVLQDFEIAASWYEKAAEQGAAQGQHNLAVCYRWGEGVEKNAEKAIFWSQKAAEQGDADAQNLLGDLYEQKHELAAYWYAKAAEQGDARGQCNLACCYSNGYGVPHDMEKAEYWLRKSAAQGFERARNWLEEYYEK